MRTLNQGHLIENTKECVVLIHGLGRSERSLRKMEKFFKKMGFATLNLYYPSTRYTIKELVESYIKSQLLTSSLAAFEKIHFVTHSMGGIILRHFLSKYELKNLGNVVQLAPPNQGSKRADNAGWLTKMVCGPALSDLKTDSCGICHELPRVDFKLGVIASKIDGKVSIKEAQTDNMTDFLVVRRFHTFIMRAPEVIESTYNFITTGKFK